MRIPSRKGNAPSWMLAAKNDVARQGNGSVFVKGKDGSSEDVVSEIENDHFERIEGGGPPWERISQ